MLGKPVEDTQAGAKMHGSLADYIAIMRLDHSTKHIFIVPGMILAYLLRGVQNDFLIRSVVLGFVTAICIASANYTINEWLDRDFDKYHPRKSQRSAVQKELLGSFVLIEWLALLTVGLVCAWLASKTMLLVASVFAVQGVFYNVPPLRTKNKAYLDVISESINNPLRLMIGWAMIDAATLPPSSIILTYWSGGAFLMAAKRLSEYREIVASHGKDLLERYRASFAGYSEASLTASCFLYALLSVFFLAIFLIKYRVEYILAVPFVIALFAYYIILSMQPESSAQKPERLFQERGLILLVALLTASFFLLSFIDLPLLAVLTSQQFIAIR